MCPLSTSKTVEWPWLVHPLLLFDRSCLSKDYSIVRCEQSTCFLVELLYFCFGLGFIIMGNQKSLPNIYNNDLLFSYSNDYI